MNSALVAAVAVAAQLGAGGLLGLIRWEGPYDQRAWTTLLTWLAFSYAVAVLAGAMVGRISVRRQATARLATSEDRTGHEGLGSRLTASLVAAAGAAATIGLAWLPARDLVPPNNDNPGLVISLTAGAGVVVGLILALVALAARPVAVGLQATVSALWLIAIAAAAAGLATHEPYLAPRLGMLDAPSLVRATEWTGPRVLVMGAAVTGLLVSGVARWQGAQRVGASLAGFGGPALVAAAYLIAGPDDRTAAPLDQPYLASLYATAAGLLASVLVAMPGRRAPRPARPAPAASEETRPLTGDVLEVVRTASATSSQPARPSWAQGSGPYASAARTAAAQPATPAQPPAQPVVPTQPLVPAQPLLPARPVLPTRPVAAALDRSHAADPPASPTAKPAVATGTASVPTYTGTASVRPIQPRPPGAPAGTATPWLRPPSPAAATGAPTSLRPTSRPPAGTPPPTETPDSRQDQLGGGIHTQTCGSHRGAAGPSTSQTGSGVSTTSPSPRNSTNRSNDG